MVDNFFKGNNMANIYKFSDTATETHGKAKTHIELKELYMSGGCHSQLDNLLRQRCEKVMGWCYVYETEMKEYYYTQYNTPQRAYAPNKTCLRKALRGTVSNIIEIK